MKSSVKLLSQRLLITECIRGTSGHILVIFTYSTARCWLTAQFRKTGFMEKYIFKDNRRLTSKWSVLTEVKVVSFQTTIFVSRPSPFLSSSKYFPFILSKSCLGGCDFPQNSLLKIFCLAAFLMAFHGGKCYQEILFFQTCCADQR